VKPLFNRESYSAVPALLVDGVMEENVRGVDRRRYSGLRNATSLETNYRAMRLAYPVAIGYHKRTGKNAHAELARYVNGDMRLLYMHMLFRDKKEAGYVLRTLPAAAQGGVGLPGSSEVRTPVQGRNKRAKVAAVAIDGIWGLTCALSGLAQAFAEPSGTSASMDIHDNAQDVEAEMEQLQAARRDLYDMPVEDIAQLVVQQIGHSSKS